MQRKSPKLLEDIRDAADRALSASIDETQEAAPFFVPESEVK